MKQQQELIPMETGEYLKQQRLERKLSLASVARALKLDEKLLADIETGEVSHIATVYKNGYIRTYAHYLQIPEDEIQDLLSSPESSEPPVRNIFSEPPKRNPMDRWLRATSYVLASLLIGTLAWQFTHEAVRLSQGGTRLHSGTDSVNEPEGTTSQSPAQEANVQEFRGPVNASIATLGALHDNNSQGLDTAEQAWAALSRSAPGQATPAQPGESRLDLSVSADSWVEITDANGQELEMDLLRGGTEKSYHGKPPFRFLFGRATAVRLSIDGETIDLAEFTQDEAAQLNWPPKLQADNQTDSNEPDSNEPDSNETGNN